MGDCNSIRKKCGFRIFDHYMVFDVYDIILNVILYSDLTSEVTKNDLRKCT